MSISRTTYKTWRVRVDVGNKADGSRAVISKTFKTKREAVAYEALMREKARTDVVVRDKIRLEDYVYEWYLPEVEKRVRFSTLRRYKIDIRLRILPALGNKYLDEITHTDVQCMLDVCATYKVAKTSRETLRQILNHANNAQFLRVNVANETYKYPAEKVKELNTDAWLTTFALHDAFIKNVDNRLFRTVCVVGLGFGLRMDEIFGLDWSDVDFDARLIHVKRAYIKAEKGYKLDTPKTKMSVRSIPMRPFIYDELQALYNARYSLDNSVCSNVHGRRANPAKTAQRWRTYTKKHGLQQLHIGNMRHSFATACLNAGVDVTKVSKLLGHSNITTTVNHYLRFKADDLVDEFSGL